LRRKLVRWRGIVQRPGNHRRAYFPRRSFLYRLPDEPML
jgi:hypothetical protein